MPGLAASVLGRHGFLAFILCFRAGGGSSFYRSASGNTRLLLTVPSQASRVCGVGLFRGLACLSSVAGWSVFDNRSGASNSGSGH